MTTHLNLKSLICHLFFGLLVGLLLGGPSYAQFAEPLFVEAADYTTIDSVDDCEETLHRGKVRKYSRCADPDKLFETARTFALKNNMPLVILWGFDSCPACEDLEYRLFHKDMRPSNRVISGSLKTKQKAQFSDYTKGKNQIALVRMNSGLSIEHNHEFANKIGANKLASELGNANVWSPMFMVVNPKTLKLASNDYFSAYSYCSLGEELAKGLAQANILDRDPNWEKACFMPAEDIERDLTSWESECEDNHYLKCFWAGAVHNINHRDLRDSAPDKSEESRLIAERLFVKACDNGLITACSYAGRVKPRKDKKYTQDSVSFFRRGCNQNDMSACGNLAAAYKFGEGGLRKNTAMAVMYYERACNTFDPWACAQLGEMAFYKDPGTKKYQSSAKKLLAFGCRDEIEWACEDKFK